MCGSVVGRIPAEHECGYRSAPGPGKSVPVIRPGSLMKVMIVDDSAAMRLMIRDWVSRIADTVVERSDGAEAVEAYRETSPDWTIMDIRMPRMDGLEATRRLRQVWPDSRIILVSSYGLAGVAEAAKSAGARHCLHKEELYRLPGLMVAGDASDGVGGLAPGASA